MRPQPELLFQNALSSQRHDRISRPEHHSAEFGDRPSAIWQESGRAEDHWRASALLPSLALFAAPALWCGVLLKRCFLCCLISYDQRHPSIWSMLAHPVGLFQRQGDRDRSRRPYARWCAHHPPSSSFPLAVPHCWLAAARRTTVPGLHHCESQIRICSVLSHLIHCVLRCWRAESPPALPMLLPASATAQLCAQRLHSIRQFAGSSSSSSEQAAAILCVAGQTTGRAAAAAGRSRNNSAGRMEPLASRRIELTLAALLLCVVLWALRFGWL